MYEHFLVIVIYKNQTFTTPLGTFKITDVIELGFLRFIQGITFKYNKTLVYNCMHDIFG